MQRLSWFVGFLSPALAMAQAVQHTVVPASAAQCDAPSHLWIAGASRDVRQQTLVGSSHLTALLGRQITAIEWRRSAANETFGGGEADLTVTLSHSGRVPSRASLAFAANAGNDATVVFAGRVALPTSPPGNGAVIGWGPTDVVRVPLTSPFTYLGGVLCVDVVGQAVAGQHANWWMADAVFEDLAGVAVERGAGCGTFTNTDGQWSRVTERLLVPGCHAEFVAYGPPGGLAVAMFGLPASQPLPLVMLGLPSPGCSLQLASLDVLLPTWFVPEVHPLLQGRGTACVRAWIPDDPACFGASLATQWFDLTQLATSNTVEWTVASALPTGDLAGIEGHPSEAMGNGSPLHAHVLRFEHR